MYHFHWERSLAKRFQVQLDGKKDGAPRERVLECMGGRARKHVLCVLCESLSWNIAEAVWLHKARP